MGQAIVFHTFGNRRSLLARDDLLSAIGFALESVTASGETFIVADPTPLRLSEIVEILRAGQGRKARLFSVPPALFKHVMGWLCHGDIWDRIGGSLVVDPAMLIAAGWRPVGDTPLLLPR